MLQRLCIVMFSALIAAGAFGDPPLKWRERDFIEVETMFRLPPAILEHLGIRRPGIGGVADRGEPFNPTDYVNPEYPMRRFVVAGHGGDFWIVVIEHGGIALGTDAYLYVDGKCTEHWRVSGPAESLDAVLSELDVRGGACDGE